MKAYSKEFEEILSSFETWAKKCPYVYISNFDRPKTLEERTQRHKSEFYLNVQTNAFFHAYMAGVSTGKIL